MLCRKCGYNHLTTVAELDCASGKRRKPGGTSVKVQVPSVDPGASVSEVSEPEKAERPENGKLGVTESITKGRPRRYESNAARQKAYRERLRR